MNAVSLETHVHTEEEEVEVVDAEDAPAVTDTPTDTGGIMGNLEAAIEKARRKAEADARPLPTFFAEDTPAKIIEALKPDVFAKGADYTVEQIPEAKIVQGYGGRIVLAELAEGYSTTATIARLTQ